MSTIVVVGASGFIGSNLVAALLARGDRVVAVNAGGAEVAGCAQTVAFDRLCDLEGICSESVVINVAAYRYDPERFALAQSDILRHNVDLADGLYHFCAERGIGEVRLASSIAVYPAALAEMDDAVAIDLNAPPHAGEAFYAWSKRHAEIVAGLYRERFGINTVIFRLSNPYGPHDSVRSAKAHVAPAFVMKALDAGTEFSIRGDAGVERDFVFVDDVVALFIQTLGWRGRSAVFNVATGRTTSLQVLAETVLRVAGVEKRIVAGAPGAFGPAVRRVRADRVRAEFGLRFASLEEGMRPTVEWYRHAYRP